MLKIRLFCNQGMSTSILVQRMKEAARKSGIEADILAFPAAEMEAQIEGIDCALIGPQVSFMIESANEICALHNVPVDIIPMADYGLCNGANVLSLALKLIRKKGSRTKKNNAITGGDLMDYEQIIMQIIVNGGDARSASLKAVNAARVGNLDEADKLIQEAKEAFSKAHLIQTELIQDEARGNRKEVTLLMVHAQDHLMNALTVHDLAVALIEESKLRIELQNKIEGR